MSNRIWIRWLEVASVATIGLGLMAAFASHPASQGPWLHFVDLVAWPLDGEPASFSAGAFAANAVTGGVMAGWGSLMLALSRGPIARGDASARRAVAVGLGVWFVVDSAGSIAASYLGNVALNLASLVIFAVPLVMLERDAAHVGPSRH